MQNNTVVFHVPRSAQENLGGFPLLVFVVHVVMELRYRKNQLNNILVMLSSPNPMNAVILFHRHCFERSTASVNNAEIAKTTTTTVKL